MNHNQIGKKIVAQYEIIRRGGAANMLDEGRVKNIAFMEGFVDLSNCSHSVYREIIRSYVALTEQYGIFEMGDDELLEAASGDE